MKKLLLIGVVALWAGVSTGFAQRPDSLNRQPIIKVTPLTLFDLDNTLQAGIEIPLPNPKYSVQQELGYGHSAFNFFPSEREDYPNKETWRFRTQLRMYYRQNRNGAGYFAAEYLFKKNSIREWRAQGMDCANPWQCAYFENRMVNLGRFLSAYHLKMGWQYILSPRMNLDFYWGLGLRSLTVRNLSVENETLFTDDEPVWFRPDTPGRYGPAPSLSVGFHLGWILGPLPVR
ncbi:DUF3575 domain-containing protein [Telluribacter sp. SYSU D00476]|uniref:DUF3575 domain-containing protein n=1 Tax=Telluribacter sp. SYSU D00476 TaxID=2811430 RepID=UPI001FF2F808|nr:DUF3575 domain-containing protein [Telluribacter sp. SYSU D00476]